jgi:beta-glucosidase
VSEDVISDKVKRNLRVKFMAGLFDSTAAADTSVLHSEAHRALALEMARESIVLLKNQGSILPLDASKIKRIAVIGPNAATARTGGGGSSHVSPYYGVSPVEGIRQFLGDDAVLIYAMGDELRTSPVPAVPAPCLRPDSAGGKGLLAEFFANGKLEGKPALSRTDTVVDFNWEDGPPAEGMPRDNFSVRWSGFLAPPVTRKYRLFTVSDDGVRLSLGGKVLIDNWTDHGSTLDSADVELEAGKSYPVRIEYYENGGSAVLLFGWDLPADKKQDRLVAEAVKAASGADVAIVCAGTSDSFESEGFDRTGGLRLPGNQDELISAVAKANPRTVVVLNTGTPVIIRNWQAGVPALIEAFFPGQEGGNALAGILFGKYNPSGKLPFSFISGYDQTPAYKGYAGKDLEAPYTEGIFVGYRYLEKNKLVPSYPFGFGLSFTTFSYSPMRVTPEPGGNYVVTLKVKNTGKMAGSETVQLYVADGHSRVPRPVKELKAFAKLYLEPGQEREVKMRLDPRSFAYYDVTGRKWKIEPGMFTLLAGASSTDIRQRFGLNVK